MIIIRRLLRAWAWVRFIWQYVSFYVGLISLVLMIVTAYNTTIRDWAYYYLNWEITLLQFTVAIFVVIAIGALFEYFVTLPNLIARSNYEVTRHKNPIYDEVCKVKQEQSELNKKLDEILERLPKP
ncbi:MAG: hypothetical protein PHQ43_04315 [Dehalococcoidales bacterium]|nr:hypothetical protein [Dehalococcoidales bacterium]